MLSGAEKSRKLAITQLELRADTLASLAVAQW